MTRARTTLVTALLLALALTPVTAGGALAADPTLANSVTITIGGADANALALCLNAVKKADAAYQQNKCKNVAYAKNGDLVLKNTEIFVVQTNDAAGDVAGGANTVELTIQGGDATALAACLNAVKKADKVYQQNKCKNHAFAQGGDVILKNVAITIVQENLASGGDLSNSVTITIAGGDANALALCLNAVDQGDKAYQQNKCKNHAFAQGGDVVLRNTQIFVVQTNDADGDLSSAANTVDLTIRGGDATALAACLNAVEQGDKVYQQNKCKNQAYAQDGGVVLSDVDIVVIQENL
jgi:hypothetical protein